MKTYKRVLFRKCFYTELLICTSRSSTRDSLYRHLGLLVNSRNTFSASIAKKYWIEIENNNTSVFQRLSTLLQKYLLKACYTYIVHCENCGRKFKNMIYNTSTYDCKVLDTIGGWNITTNIVLKLFKKCVRDSRGF